MVREILEDTFTLFSLSSFRKGIARGSGNKPPAIARLEFLRSRVAEALLPGSFNPSWTTLKAPGSHRRRCSFSIVESRGSHWLGYRD